MTNSQSQKSVKTLKKALLELLGTSSMNDIRIKTLCQKAELNRSTFYTYYSDIFDLLDDIEKDYLSLLPFEDFSRPNKVYETVEQYTTFMEIVRDNWETFIALWKNGTLPFKTQKKVREYLVNYCKDNHLAVIHDPVRLDYVADVLFELTMTQLLLWGNKKFPVSCIEFAKYILTQQKQTMSLLEII